ncbi:MAG: hypothetical protein IRZ07_28465 [Microbispora sp.]|nr:hypothetical protein [Microbispora sp.]PZN23932.1 MAG: hypothetical protein DIU75_04225 [Mycolicibacterium hassiacum]
MVTAQREGCPGKHTRQPLAGAEQLTWYPLDDPDPCRVLDATCSRCGPVLYELVSYGGAYAIRRTTRPRGVSETPRVRRSRVDGWWLALLLGAAH